MGYRSDVYLCIKKEDYEELISRVENYQDNEEVKSLIKYANINTVGADAVVLSFGDVKWYNSYKDVKYIMSYISEIYEKGKPYSYIRIGENYGDIEKLYSYGENNDDYSCDHINIYQSVEIY